MRTYHTVSMFTAQFMDVDTYYEWWTGDFGCSNAEVLPEKGPATPKLALARQKQCSFR